MLRQDSKRIENGAILTSTAIPDGAAACRCSANRD